MPKVGTTYYSDKSIPKPVEVDINFGIPGGGQGRKGTKQFWIKLPEDVGTFHGIWNNIISSNTYDEVERRFKNDCKAFYETKKQTKKVIGFLNGFNVVMGDEDPRGGPNYDLGRMTDRGTFYQSKEEDKHFKTQMFSLGFIIGLITTSGEKEFFHWDEKDQLRQVKGPGGCYSECAKYTYIDWTPEREAWFRSTYSQLTKMINSVRGFFNQDEKKFLAAIENPSKLLQ